MKYKLLNDSISFRFLQNIHDGFFRSSTNWGFELQGQDYNTTKSRWGVVEQIGDAVDTVAPGDYILIEPSKWSIGVTINGELLWKTKESYVQLVSNEIPTDLI
jgi:hypothetical protein